MSGLSEVARLRRQARERNRTWGAGVRGDMGTASPMFGSRAGGRPQPQIVVPARAGETIALAGEVEVPAGGGELEFQTILNRSGWRSESMPTAGPTSSVAAYYDVYVAVEPTDGAPMVDGQVRVRADGSSLWGPVEDESWTLPWVTAFSGTAHLPATPAGTKFTVFADHGSGSARTLRCSLVARLVDTPRVIAADPPPAPPADALVTAGSDFGVANPSVTLTVPSGAQVGDMMVFSAWAANQAVGAVGPIGQPSGLSEILNDNSRRLLVWRRADAADAAGAQYTFSTSGGSGSNKMSVLLCVYQSGFPASGDPFGTVVDLSLPYGDGTLSIDTPDEGDFALVVAYATTTSASDVNVELIWQPPTQHVGYGPSGVHARRPRMAHGIAGRDVTAECFFGTNYASNAARRLTAVAVDA